MTRVTFPAARLDPYCGHGENSEATPSGEALEKRPGQADPREGVAAGCAGDGFQPCRYFEPGTRSRPCRHWCADRNRSAKARRARSLPPEPVEDGRERPCVGGRRRGG